MVRGAKYHPRVIWSRLKARVPIVIWLLAVAAAVFLATLNTKGTYFAGVMERKVVEVGPTIAGTISSYEVISGQSVTNGQIIAKLDQTDLNTQRGSALWDRAMEILSIDRELTGMTYDVQARLDSRQLSFAEDKAELLAIDQQLTRIAQLVEDRAIAYNPQVEADFKAKREALKEAVRMYPKSIKNLQEYLSWTKRQKSRLLENMNPSGYNDSPMIDSVHRIELELAKTDIRAPIDGVISSTLLPAGQYVQAGTPMLSMVSTNNPVIIAMLEEGTALEPKVNDEFLVRSNSAKRNQYFRARIISIAPDITQINLESGMFFANVKRGQFFRMEMIEQAPFLPGQAVTIVTRKPFWDTIKDWGRDKLARRSDKPTDSEVADAR